VAPVPQESSAEYDDQQDEKSFDSLASFTSDVSDKVGNAANEASTGVTRIFDGLTNLLTTSTSNGQLQPTVGFSFGLPQGRPGYGGYPTNPVGTGGATNPYYTADQGLEVGPVNLNPLFSFQAATTDTGELAIKPLVNLHLTPNGCGILGCKEYNEYGEPTLTKSIADALKDPLDALKNPFGIFDKDEHSYMSGQYTAPSYHPPGSGYGAPQSGYGAPQSGYGAPQTGYESPQSGYGAPQTGYETPQSGYGAPQSGYGAPSPGYGAPSDGYNPSQAYNPPSSDYMVPSTGYNPPASGHDYGLGSAHSTGHGSTHSTGHGSSHSTGHVNSNSGHGSSQDLKTQYNPSSNGDTHVHHHYYHSEEDDPTTNTNNNNNYYNNRAQQQHNTNNIYSDSDVFKRETEPSSSVAVEGVSKVSVEGAGFKFPTSRRVDPEAIRAKRQPERQAHSIDVDNNKILQIANQLKSQGSVVVSSVVADEAALTCGSQAYLCCGF